MIQMINGIRDAFANVTGIRVLPDRLLHPKGPNVETLQVPGYYQSQGYTCGFVAGLMIIHYFRPEAKAERFYDSIRPHKTMGVSRRRLMDCLRIQRIRVTWRTDLDFDGIADALDRGRPIAVVVRTRNPYADHWVVIYGYGRKPNRVYLAANGLPLLSRKEFSYKLFRARLWEMPGFGLLCARPTED